jgi:hypothetical protein
VILKRLDKDIKRISRGIFKRTWKDFSGVPLTELSRQQREGIFLVCASNSIKRPRNIKFIRRALVQIHVP